MQNIMAFPYDDNLIVSDLYSKNDNYKIINTNAKTRNAIVFFASNGLYSPNTVEEFSNTMVKNNRYEWDNIAHYKMIHKHYKLVILVRDIYKQWYIKGINKSVNTQDKLIELIKNLTKGYNITTVGNSAGAYIATIVGLKINADKIFNIAGQYEIRFPEREPLLSRVLNDDEYNKYFSLTNLLEQYNNKNIYYLYPAFSDTDIYQNEKIKQFNIKTLKFNESEHPVTIPWKCFPYLFVYKKKTLDKIFRDYKDRLVTGKNIEKQIRKFYGKYNLFNIISK